MQKTFGYIILILFIFIYAISSHHKLTQRIATYKSQPYSLLPSGNYRYGDLYDMSYLSAFRKPNKEDSILRNDCNDQNKIDLYAICDSYTWMFFGSADYYCGVNKLSYFRTSKREKIDVALDTTKKNILLLEFSERNLRPVLSDKKYIDNALPLILNDQHYKTTADLPTKSNTKPGKRYISFLKSIFDIKLWDFIFCDDINTNLESNVWDYAIFTPLKEFKADLNYRLFNATDKDVRISRRNHQLYYNITIDTTQNTSSFSYVSNQEIDTLVSRLNTLYNAGIKKKFQKIYLAIIPNPVSVLEPGYGGFNYNHLVERIQNNPKLQLPVINILPEFSKLKGAAYYPADTHWNFNGANTWLNRFNEELKKLLSQP